MDAYALLMHLTSYLVFEGSVKSDRYTVGLYDDQYMVNRAWLLFSVLHYTVMVASVA